MYNYDYNDDFANKAKKWYQVLLQVLLWIWQLPQNLIGFVLAAYIRNNGGQRRIYCIKIKDKTHEVRFVHLRTFPGGITLGEYIIIGGKWDESDVRHEYGHVRQSLYLGPLYLFVVGIPSLLWAWYWNPSRGVSYYSFYTEKWAEKLGSE